MKDDPTEPNKISKLYKQVSTEEPSGKLDEDILAMAREHVASKNVKKQASHNMRWFSYLTAASLLLVIGLILPVWEDNGSDPLIISELPKRSELEQVSNLDLNEGHQIEKSEDREAPELSEFSRLILQLKTLQEYRKTITQKGDLAENEILDHYQKIDADILAKQNALLSILKMNPRYISDVGIKEPLQEVLTEEQYNSLF